MQNNMGTTQNWHKGLPAKTSKSKAADGQAHMKKHASQRTGQMKCQVQCGSAGARPLGSRLLPKVNFCTLSCQAQDRCFAPPG